MRVAIQRARGGTPRTRGVPPRARVRLPLQVGRVLDAGDGNGAT